ncbi:MAG: hypothetical protein FWD34_07985 [Oscillospiraceae bacterium]|nr:hypothetical protein [Oscillospiraceae bacterium]
MQSRSIEEVLAELRKKHDVEKQETETVSVQTSQRFAESVRRGRRTLRFGHVVIVQAVTAVIIVLVVLTARFANPEFFEIIQTFLRENVF